MRVLVLALGVAVGGAAVVACSGEADPSYGPADGIVGRQPPAAGTVSGSSGSSGGSTSGSGSSSGGSGSGGGDGGTTSGEGGQVPQSCTVSWATQVFTILNSNGNGKCSSAACHAGGANPPAIDETSATAMYNELKAYTLAGKPFIAVGSTNPDDSSITCDITNGCGTLTMPNPPGTLTAADRTTLQTWLQCGAPNN